MNEVDKGWYESLKFLSKLTSKKANKLKNDNLNDYRRYIPEDIENTLHQFGYIQFNEKVTQVVTQAGLQQLRDLEEIERKDFSIKIFQGQEEISKKQTDFSRLLTLATIVLAIGAFLQTSLQMGQIPKEFYSNLFEVGGSWLVLFFIIGLIFWLALMGMIIYLIIMVLFKSKKKE